jgi:hypothetical protein
VTVALVEVVALPARSTAPAMIVCVPSATLAEFQPKL